MSRVLFDSVVGDIIVQEAIDLIERHEYGAEADAGFDGGEFSGPAHVRMLEEAMERLAAKHEVDVDALWRAAEAKAYEEQEQIGWAP